MNECYLVQSDNTSKIKNNLYYSDKLKLKNASLFLTVISIILHNNLIKNYDEVFEHNFLLFLYKLIFYLIKCINHFKESKEAIFYIIDIFSSIISNNNLKINNEICSLFLDEFKAIFNINDFKESKNLILLFQKFTDNLLNNEKDIPKDHFIDIIKKESELIKLLKKNYSSNFDSYFIIIYFNYILSILKKGVGKEFQDDFKYYNKILFEIYYNDNDASKSKLLLEKIYTILININIEAKDLFKLFINELVDTLKKLNSNFQKYFTLFYIIIQYISKSSNNELIIEIEKLYITESLKTDNNLFDISNKSLLVSITQMNNLNIIQFIHEYLSAVFNDKNKFQFTQEIQKLILLYIQNEKNNDLRKNIIKDIIKYLNDNKEIMSIKDACTFVLGVVKINKEDNNLINEEEVKNFFNEEFKNQINELTKANESTIESGGKNIEAKEENKENDEDEDDFDEVEG